MIPTAGSSETSTLRGLVRSYAAALDGNDLDLLLGVYREDAQLRMFAPGSTEPMGVVVGHEGSSSTCPLRWLRGYSGRCTSSITNCNVEIDGDRASGDTYCVAHHLIEGDGAPYKVVIYLSYVDEFVRDAAESWQISNRDILFRWAEEVPVLPWPGRARTRSARLIEAGLEGSGLRLAREREGHGVPGGATVWRGRSLLGEDRGPPGGRVDPAPEPDAALISGGLILTRIRKTGAGSPALPACPPSC